MAEVDAPAVATAVMTILSIYRNCEDLFVKLRRKRINSNYPGPIRALEDSLRQAHEHIRAQQRAGLDRFGDAFFIGDTVAEEGLQAVIQDLGINLSKELFLALQDDSHSIGGPACYASDDARTRTLFILDELFHRLARREASLSRPPPISRRLSEMAPEVVPDSMLAQMSAMAVSSPSIAQMSAMAVSSPSVASPPPPSSSLLHRPSIDKRKSGRSFSFGAQPSPSPKPESPSYLPQLSWFKRKQTSTERRADSNSSSQALPGVAEGNEHFLSPENTPQAEQTATSEYFSWQSSGSNGTQRVTSPFSPMSPMPAVESPEELRRHASVPSTLETTGTVSTYDPAFGTISSIDSINGTWKSLDSAVSGVSGRLGKSQRGLLQMPKPDNNWLGLCKGAVALQRGEEGAFREQRELAFGKVTYKMCSNCAFTDRLTGRISKTKIFEADGVRFRWPFLAKSHVQQAKVTDNVHAYLCVFCLSLGRECAVMQGIDAFIRHTAFHRGEEFSETLLDRVRCINGWLALENEDFDINLTPLADDALVRKQSAVLPDSLIDGPPVSFEATSAYPGPANWNIAPDADPRS